MELCHIERMGTGTGDMIKRCRDAGLSGPEFTLTDGFVTTVRRKPAQAFEAVGGSATGQVTPKVTPEVAGQVALRGKVLRKSALQEAATTLGRPTPQVTPQVGGQVSEEIRRVVLVLPRSRTRKQLQEALSLRDRMNFDQRYLKPALEAGFVEPTIPTKPRSRFQKYRLTAKGRVWLAAQTP